MGDVDNGLEQPDLVGALARALEAAKDADCAGFVVEGTTVRPMCDAEGELDAAAKAHEHLKHGRCVMGCWFCEQVYDRTIGILWKSRRMWQDRALTAEADVETQSAMYANARKERAEANARIAQALRLIGVAAAGNGRVLGWSSFDVRKWLRELYAALDGEVAGADHAG